jgi:hypothetical protein
MARLIKVDGTVTYVQPEDGKTFTNEELRNLIPGTRLSYPLDIQEYYGERVLWRKEATRLNEVATAEHREQSPYSGEKIYGDALIATYEEING